MTELPRRTIEDLIARYENEPELKDIYVEGAFDQEILTGCLREAGIDDRVVYWIDSVDIPVELLKKHHLSEGMKQRVIALARELSAVGSSHRCVVDRDFDHWIGAIENTPGLIWTEYSALELYFFKEDVLKDILIVAAKARINDWNTFTDSLIHALKTLFAIRLTALQLQWSIDWLTPDRCLQFSNSTIVFDRVVFIERLLQKNSKIADLVAFNSKYDEIQKTLVGDHRLFIHGHDFVEMLAWSVGKSSQLKQFARSDSIQRLFVVLLQKADGLLDLAV